MTQKRVAAIHDISGIGKCSLTVALPIISSVGIETAIMPTAVLSTHTGGFTNYTYRDLTDDMRPFAAHWKSLDLKFDAIYSGFLGSFEQIDIVKEFIDTFGGNGCISIVDPAMADNGKLYSLFDDSFAAAMVSLCAKADMIVPNITEAVMLLGRDYEEGPYTREYIDGLLGGLAETGASKIVLTGVHYDNDVLGTATYDRETGEKSFASSERIEGSYHGTGDIYASALIAAYLSGKSLHESAQIAVDYVCGSILRTKNAGTDVRFGVNFEEGIQELIKKIKG